LNDDAQLSITQLNDSLQHKAVEDFATFYLPLFDANNLEMMSSYDVVPYMTDINAQLTYGRFMPTAQRISDTVNTSFTDYVSLIEQLDQKYFTSGNPALPWQDWYAAHFAQLATS